MVWILLVGWLAGWFLFFQSHVCGLHFQLLGRPVVLQSQRYDHIILGALLDSQDAILSAQMDHGGAQVDPGDAQVDPETAQVDPGGAQVDPGGAQV